MELNILVIFPILAGFLSGLLVNYLADVLPITRRFSQPTCAHCDASLPTGKYLAMATCPACGKPRNLRAWIVQLLGVGISLCLWIFPPTRFTNAIPNPFLAYLAGLIVVTYFGVIFVIDLEHRLILHPVSLFGALLGLLTGLLLYGIVPTLLGGLGGFAIMLIFYLFGILFARIRARRMKAAGQEPDDEEALGAGDVILAGVLGLMLGWPLIWFGLLLGILLGGFITLPMLLVILILRRYKQDAWMVFIPYGPFFLISATLILYFPNLLSALVPK